MSQSSSLQFLWRRSVVDPGTLPPYFQAPSLPPAPRPPLLWQKTAMVSRSMDIPHSPMTIPPVPTNTHSLRTTHSLEVRLHQTQPRASNWNWQTYSSFVVQPPPERLRLDTEMTTLTAVVWTLKGPLFNRQVCFAA
uniref:Uncharacterized protein n=1 Tax=Eutreptiella gymnastica TaxID=73025 RepID=A0A7S4D2G2_9EUGL